MSTDKRRILNFKGKRWHLAYEAAFMAVLFLFCRHFSYVLVQPERNEASYVVAIFAILGLLHVIIFYFCLMVDEDYRPYSFHSFAVLGEILIVRAVASLYQVGADIAPTEVFACILGVLPLIVVFHTTLHILLAEFFGYCKSVHHGNLCCNEMGKQK